MRGIDEKPTQLFSYVDLERRIPLDHPLRAIRALVDKVLAGQSRTLAKLYARDGRPGIPPERLLRALLLQALLCHMGHIMMENCHGLIVDARWTEANGAAEREAALDMIKDNAGRGSTIGADKNYDTTDFVAGCRQQGCVPHVAQNNKRRRSAIDARTTRHAGYKISQIKRKRIEEPFGWMKCIS